MDGVQVMTSAVEAAHRWYAGTVADVTPEQATYKPEGAAHGIAALAAHAVQAEDWVINQLLQGKPMLWDSGGWSEKIGIPNVWNLKNEGADSVSCQPQALQPYADAVFANTRQYL